LRATLRGRLAEYYTVGGAGTLRKRRTPNVSQGSSNESRMVAQWLHCQGAPVSGPFWRAP